MAGISCCSTLDLFQAAGRLSVRRDPRQCRASRHDVAGGPDSGGEALPVKAQIFPGG